MNGGAPEMAECSMGKQANVPMKYFEEGEEKEIVKSETPLMWLVVTVHFS